MELSEPCGGYRSLETRFGLDILPKTSWNFPYSCHLLPPSCICDVLVWFHTTSQTEVSCI